MRAAPKVLVCWAGRPGYIPPPVLCENQVTIYSHHDRANPGTIDPPRKLADRQDYDLEQVVRQIDDPASFDLICVSSGANENNQPRNLHAFDCPKVLLVGDTHHVTANPIRFVMNYLEAERYDMVVSLHNRDHMKWFRRIGDIKPGWFPGLTAQNVPHPFQQERDQHIGFVGSWQRSHPRRKSFINRIRRDKLPFDHKKLSRINSAAHYATSLVSFNCSLNGDFNMRIPEVLSAGGCLLSDRLAPQSGLDDALIDGVEYLSYASYREFRDKAQHLLTHPREAVEIATRGLEKYDRTMRPDLVAAQFLEWAVNGGSSQHDYHDRIADIDNASVARRLTAYEWAQTKQLWQQNVPVLAVGEVARHTLADYDGLVRVTSAAIESPDQLAQMKQTEWSLVIADSSRQQLAEKLNIARDGLFIL